MKRFFGAKSDSVTSPITTHFYTAWTPLVDRFIQTIGNADENVLRQLYTWLNQEGKWAFQKAQGLFFKEHINAYRTETTPCALSLFKLSQEQITAGFNGWFNELLKKFPDFSPEALDKPFKQLIEGCSDKKYHTYVAVRTILTQQHVQEGKGIDFIMESYKALNTYNDLSIASMQEYLDSQSTPQQENTALSKLS